MDTPSHQGELTNRVLEADAARRQAMIHGDVDALLTLLADDLVWTHSSGATEGKADFIGAIAAQAVRYESLEIDGDEVREEGALAVHNGVLRGSASRGGQNKKLHARFLAVWRFAGDKPELMAWQSTNVSD